jgi:nifR3 family TIM-barrel protein
MVSAPGLLRQPVRNEPLVGATGTGRPLWVQLVGGRAEELGRAASRAVTLGARLIDLNLGCPVHKVQKTGGGVALMREPERAAALLRAARRACPEEVPVTVKMRLGWDNASRNAPELARRLVDEGAAAVTVHGRTGAQGFRGRVDLRGIREVVEAVRVPVIGNGDVRDPGSLGRMRQTGCAAVMIGRAALGNPWIFPELSADLLGTPAPEGPTAADRLQIMRRHLELESARLDQTGVLLGVRKHLAWYARGLPGAAAFRRSLAGLRTQAELAQAIDALGAGRPQQS